MLNEIEYFIFNTTQKYKRNLLSREEMIHFCNVIRLHNMNEKIPLYYLIKTKLEIEN